MLKPIALAALLALVPAIGMAAPETTTAPPAAATPPPSAIEIAAARAEADRLIDEADARDLFSNITTDRDPKVRHNRSGLVCTFRPGDRVSRILVFNQGTGIARADDVGCNTTSGDVILTHYATRYTPAMSAKDALTAAAQAIKQRWSTARWYEEDSIEVSSDRTGMTPLPQTWLAHYVVDIDGQEHYTSARVAEYNGWIIKQRATIALSKVSEGQLLAAVEWMWTLEAIVDAGAARI